MSKAKKRSYASMPAEEPSRSYGDVVEWPSPIRDGWWTDSDGTRWSLRGEGGNAPAKRVEHLLRSPEAGVLLFYGPGAPTVVKPADREALWRRISPYLRERTVRARGDHTDFKAAEFKDDQRRSLLIIEESC